MSVRSSANSLKKEPARISGSSIKKEPVRISEGSIKKEPTRTSANSLKKEPDKVPKELRKCDRCPNYFRKLEEVQQSLSGREKIIEVLQSQHKLLQSRYKNLLDECECLRLERTRFVQDNLYLKERENLKLCCKSRNQDQAIQIQSASVKNCYNRGSLNNRNQVEVISQPSYTCSPYTPISINAEPIIPANQEKGDLLKDIINKILDELKHCKCLNEQDMQKISDALNGSTRSSRVSKNASRSSKETPTKVITYCQDDSKSAPCLQKNCQSTRGETKVSRRTSAPCLAPCNTKNSRSNSSRNSEVAATKIPKSVGKDKCQGPCKQSQEKDAQVTPPPKPIEEKNTQCKAPCYVSKGVSNSNLNEQEVEALAGELIKREIEFSECKCRFSQQIYDLTENNAMLSETLEVVTAENKANIQKICQLSEELKNLSAEYDKYVCGSKCATAKLENELENTKSNQETLRRSSENEKMYMQGQIAKLQQGNEELKNELAEYKRCDEIQCNKLFVANEKVLQLTQTVHELTEENDNLRNQVQILTDENTRLKCRCNTAETKSEQNENQIDDLNDSLQAQLNKVTSLRQELEEKQHENDDLRNMLDECRRKLKELEDKCKCGELCDEMQKLRAEVAKKQAIINELEKTITNFNTVMAQCEQNVEELSQENQNLLNSNGKLRKDIEALKADFRKRSQDLLDENDDLRQALEQCKKEGQELINKYKNIAAELDNENKQLANDLEEARQANSSLLSQLDQLKRVHCQNMAALSEENRKLNEALAKCEQELCELESIKKQLNAAQQRESCYIQQINELKSLVAKVKEECAQKCAEAQRLKRSFDDAERDRSSKDKELSEVTKKYHECKSSCTAKCSENDHLKQKLDQANCQCTSLFDTVERLEKVLADLQASYDKKCDELENIKEKYSSTLRECKNLMNKKMDLEKELYEITRKYQELEKAYEANANELNRLRKQCESCSRQSQITREEYCTLKKEYKDIKNMLSEQIQAYKLNTDDLQHTHGGGCKVLASLKQKLLEKEQQIAALQEKVQDSSYEIIELKDYIHKLISDNNILKSAINNLIDNLESKIKGSNVGTTTSCVSTEMIASQILQSLTFMEHNVAQKTPSCPTKECKCPKNASLQKIEKPRTCPGCKEIKDSSTDSDDCQFFDQKSIEVLKEALNELKESKQSTMREKSCDCERVTEKKNSATN